MPPRPKFPHTPEGAELLRKAIELDPQASFRVLGRKYRACPKLMARLARAYNIPYAGQRMEIKTRGILQDIFLRIARRKISWLEVARQMKMHPNTILSWRKGEWEPRLFELECLAQLAGVQLTLEPVCDIIDETKETSNETVL